MNICYTLYEMYHPSCTAGVEVNMDNIDLRAFWADITYYENLERNELGTITDDSNYLSMGL